MSFVGHLNCDKCGYTILTDPASITIWWCVDAIKQLIEVTCPTCGELKEGRLEMEDLLAFKTHNVKVVPLTMKFKVLSEAEINDWDSEAIDREFASGISKFA